MSFVRASFPLHLQWEKRTRAVIPILPIFWGAAQLRIFSTLGRYRLPQLSNRRKAGAASVSVLTAKLGQPAPMPWASLIKRIARKCRSLQ
jgi:hypothetical protein